MGRYLLCTKEADTPYEVEELDLRVYSIEELAYLIYHDLPLLPDEFIDEKLLTFIEKELEMPEISGKIRRFYDSPADFDAAVTMLLSETGYYTESEMNEFRDRVVERRKKNGPERLCGRADILYEKKRYNSAIRLYRTLLKGPRDGRMGSAFYTDVMEKLANCFGRLSEFDKALDVLEDIVSENGSLRVMKKMYDTCILAGREPGGEVYRKVPEETLKAWQMDYWNRETQARQKADEDPRMQIFFKDTDEAQAALAEYTENAKDAFRGMLE